tara:strand:- start:298 stop:726 length:429 start_codon:yes stop_codon:yes gene_type:complete
MPDEKTKKPASQWAHLSATTIAICTAVAALVTDKKGADKSEIKAATSEVMKAQNETLVAKLRLEFSTVVNAHARATERLHSDVRVVTLRVEVVEKSHESANNASTTAALLRGLGMAPKLPGEPYGPAEAPPAALKLPRIGSR